MKRNPPPSTPTPRRFLPAKKRTATTTPAPHPQFQSTPRFGSSSVPRPTQTRESLVEDVDDDDEDEDDDGFTDSSAAAAGERRRLDHTHDSIDLESEGAGTSPGDDGRSPDRGSDLEEEVLEAGTEAEAAGLLDTEDAPLHVQSSPEQRQAKRRRISISPIGESSPLPRHYEDTELVPAPRFKPTDDDAGTAAAAGILPAAFSPQRRGEKYLAGGLAAELQGWLSEAKGWDGADKALDDATTLRIVVDEVRPGRQMNLVRGRAGSDAAARGFILAGQGRLTGLGGTASRAAVEQGGVVMVGPPVWDTEMEGCVWTVACDWRVV
ncbi:hypothetical protein HRG_007027 [Hirsutella rhossiliensis]|uniref:Uncharacterized protein n=1 Tax=Hirsutella rhossiliensis TaxID=111463 RepID=A0A9P8MZG1_9HYPO|nr:uncharacterized protein HRG_07027 [Hirsutella rhossiliensis]KAH0961947.1 hypothetical protein HRG_07027 [Hirsutella rhossiliensis]